MYGGASIQRRVVRTAHHFAVRIDVMAERVVGL
jgi:hypothetical protein